MSTDGSDSSSSQIRRFGLYRTIDARTEEFLRLSRKRQMRQGCACAAISTTITVTVVVSVIIIYEYSIISQAASSKALTPSWLSLMNTSSDDLPFEVKFDKSKIGFDPTTFKFLPIILKTLNRNKYFDKNIDESSTHNPLQHIRETKSSNEVYNNVFSDTRNWMRMPTSRLYTIEYKTSPIVYFKNPTRNIEYFKKVRKIRDYQRIMNYVDKMISERVTFGSTLPMAKNFYSIYKTSPMTEYTTPMTKTKESGTNTQKDLLKKSMPSEKKTNCHCPKRMSALIHKIIHSLKNSLPNFTDNNILHVTKPCDEKNTIKTTQNPQTIPSELYEETVLKTATETNGVTKFTTPYVTSLSESKLTQRPLVSTDSTPKIDYKLSRLTELLHPSLQRKMIDENMFDSYETSTSKQYLEGTIANYKAKEYTTKPMKSITVAKQITPAITMSDYITKINLNKTKSFQADQEFTERVLDDYVYTTPNIVNNFKILDAHSLELVKRKIISNRNGSKWNKNEDHTNIYQESNHLLQKMAGLVFYSTLSTSAYSDTTLASTEASSTASIETTILENKMDSEVPDNKILLESQGKSKNYKTQQNSKPDDITLEEEIEKASSDDIVSEENIKSLENMIKTLNNTEVRSENKATELYEWELIKIGEDTYDINDNIVNSMIPQNRASYLEMQRSDGKQEENQDYDNNLNNYLFE